MRNGAEHPFAVSLLIVDRKTQKARLNYRFFMPRGVSDTMDQKSSRGATGISLNGEKPAAGGHEIAWTEVIPPDQWALYKRAIQGVRQAGIPFLIGGGFGLAGYTGRWRNTKDMDLYVLPSEQKRMIEVLTKAGFDDYYSTRPYDRGWIYRSHREGIIVDVIWSMANRRAEVDSVFFQRATTLAVRDEKLQLVPPEELLWCKLYVFQRDHCDWTDVMNLIYAVGPQLDWEHVLHRLGPDLPVLKSILTLFAWLSPARAAQLPASLCQRLGLDSEPIVSHEEEIARIRLLDTRAWFAALQPRDKVLEV